MMIYPTTFALEALGGAPTGAPSPVKTRCSCCGRPIAAGEPAAPTGFGPSFMDDLSLAARTGVVCGWCVPFLSAEVMRATQKVVITREGVFPLAKDVHRAWFLLTPPEPPYVAVVSDTMIQHLVWRTPVTLSNDLQIVRLGQRLLKIRRGVLLDALKWAQEAIACIDASKTAEKPTRHPYVSLDREMASFTHGLFRTDVARDPRAEPWLARLRKLTLGETWALATLAKRETPTPEKPESLPFFLS